ncbi:hypothetical protein PVAP13_8NG002902 [Panicum virgatum]|uniref:Uncharacterized protein n=1 Tax=Panicum virgatum TaxID=38727 RepID=A0A8T0P086_PANVG|nr:hypothetical protein PVAP13_8NG002902 [Panicum virgatum]
MEAALLVDLWWKKLQTEGARTPTAAAAVSLHDIKPHLRGWRLPPFTCALSFATCGEPLSICCHRQRRCISISPNGLRATTHETDGVPWQLRIRMDEWRWR